MCWRWNNKKTRRLKKPSRFWSASAHLRILTPREDEHHIIIRERQGVAFDHISGSIRQHGMDSVFLRHACILTSHQGGSNLTKCDLVAFDAIITAKSVTARVAPHRSISVKSELCSCVCHSRDWGSRRTIRSQIPGAHQGGRRFLRSTGG